jgi:hypothetical protein
MTKKEAAIVSAYTGILIGDFSQMHEYIEKLLERPVFTHELANKEVWNLIKEKSKSDFIGIEIEGGGSNEFESRNQ